MAQQRDDHRPDKEATPGTPRSSKEWAKAGSKSPDDFPEVERASAGSPPEASRETIPGKRGLMEQPARAERDAAWQSKDHLDPERDPKKPSRSGAAKDAEGQAERGSIDQTITDKGYTEDR